MVIVWRLRGNIIRTAPCRLGLSHWDPYTMHRGGCLELYYCNMVEWSWWDSSLI